MSVASYRSGSRKNSIGFAWLLWGLLLLPCALGAQSTNDCNHNGIADSDDISMGSSLDCDGNGIPDECDLPGSVLFAPPFNYVPDPSPRFATLGDVDGDGDLDLAATHGLANTVSVSINDGSGNFTVSSLIPVGIVPKGIVVEDLDRDGDRDLAVVNSDSGSLTILTNDGAASFVMTDDIPLVIGALALVAGDFDSDHDLDLAVTNIFTDTARVLLNDGVGGFLAQPPMPVGQTPESLTLGDLNGDGHLDLAVGNSNSADISILLNDGAANFTAFGPALLGATPLSVIAVDFNGDGHLDLAAANSSADTASIAVNNGDGTFGSPLSIPAGESPRAIASADIDGDLDADLLVVNANTRDVSILINDGEAQWTSASSLFIGVLFIHKIAVGDLDGDRDLDFVTLSTFSDEISIALNETPFRDCNGNGVPDSCEIAQGLVEDLDANGLIDNCQGRPVDALRCAPDGLGNIEVSWTQPSPGPGTTLRVTVDGVVVATLPNSETSYVVIGSDLGLDGFAEIGIVNEDGLAARCSYSLPAERFQRGDCNLDAAFNIADPIFLLGHLFGNLALLPCADACDCNDDGNVDIADAVCLVGVLFGGAPTLPEPGFPECGVDPSPDSLSCLLGCDATPPLPTSPSSAFRLGRGSGIPEVLTAPAGSPLQPPDQPTSTYFLTSSGSQDRAVQVTLEVPIEWTCPAASSSPCTADFAGVDLEILEAPRGWDAANQDFSNEPLAAQINVITTQLSTVASPIGPTHVSTKLVVRFLAAYPGPYAVAGTLRFRVRANPASHSAPSSQLDHVCRVELAAGVISAPAQCAILEVDAASTDLGEIETCEMLLEVLGNR